jgi:F-type H+-transporting ATPase subunit b
MGFIAHPLIAASGSFLITPNVGLMIWVLVVFIIVALLLRRFVFPAIGKILDDRATGINSDIDSA